MRPRTLAILLLCCAAPSLAAAQSTRPNQVAVATSSAVDALDQDIGSQTLGPANIHAFLLRTHSEDAFRNWLRELPSVGGPRWLDPQTCQVRIDVSGEQLADWLTARAREHPDEFDLKTFAPLADTLRQRRFDATCTSAASETASNLPTATHAQTWDTIPPDQRRRVILLARRNAADHAVQILQPIEVIDGQHVQQVLDDHPALDHRLRQYLQNAPLAKVDFQSPATVHVQLHPSRQELAEMIYTAAAGKHSSDLNTGDFDRMETLRDRIADRINNVDGSATVSDDQAAGMSSPMVALPQQPPAWVDQQLDVAGHGFVAGNQLRSAHAAEHDAAMKLRTRLEALRIDENHTIDDAVRSDPRVVDAINQAIEEARPYKSEFNADGSVTTHEILDLHDFWQALTGGQ